MADVQKEIALKVTTDLGQTTAQFQSATKELQETQKALVELALAGKQGSEEFLEMENRAGQLRDAIGSVNQRVNTLASSTPKLDLVRGAMQGIAAGFAVAQGAAALFGDESEDLQKAILKTQGAMTLLNGVQQISLTLDKNQVVVIQAKVLAQRAYAVAVRLATAATRSFSAALAATGIGALVIALGYLITKLFESTDATEKNTKAIEKAREAQKLLDEQIQNTIDLKEAEIKQMETAGETAQKTATARLKLISDELIAIEKSINQQKVIIDALEGFEDKTEQNRRKRLLMAQKLKQADLQNDLLIQQDIIAKANEEEEKINAEKTKLQTENSLKARQQIITDLEVELNFRKEIGTSTLEVEERLLKEKLRYAELTKTGVMQAQSDLRLFLMRDQLQFEADQKEANKKEFETRVEANKELTRINEELRRNKLTEYQREQEDFLAQRAKMLELMRASGASEIELQLFASNTAAMIRNAANEKEVEDAKAKEDRKLSNQKAAILASIEVAKMGLQGIADLVAFFAGESEAQQKKAFEIQKRINIATTIIDGVLSAQKAYASLIGTPIVGPVLAPIAAGAAIAASLARVRAIKSTTFGATSAPSSGGGGGGIPTGGGGQQQPPAAFSPNVTPTNPTGQPNPQGGQNGTTRVIVVESDIRRVTTRVDAAERFATFG